MKRVGASLVVPPDTAAIRLALTLHAPLLGAIVVCERERRGLDCADLRAAYLTLIERPSREAAYAARKVLSARYMDCLAEWRALEALSLAGSAAAQAETRPRAAARCLVDLAGMAAEVMAAHHADVTRARPSKRGAAN